MEKERKYSVEMEGNIASITERKQKSNGKDFIYVNVAQNSGRYGRASFFPLYIDGKVLEDFESKGFKVGDRIRFAGKLESYQKDSKQTMHIKPFEIENAKLEKQKESSKETKEVEM